MVTKGKALIKYSNCRSDEERQRKVKRQKDLCSLQCSAKTNDKKIKYRGRDRKFKD